MAPPDRVPFNLESIVVGRNPRMRAVFRYLALVGPGQGTMLVTGESRHGQARRGQRPAPAQHAVATSRSSRSAAPSSRRA